MAIKQPEVLSRADFDEAVVRLRLNVSEIAKATGVPRTYLSEFRNGDRKLRPEHLGKLRDYFEEKGIEFDGDGAPADDSPAPPAPASPHKALSVATVCHFPVRADLDGAAVRDILNEIDRNDARIGELLAKKAQRATGWGAEGFQESTEGELRELFARLAANYVLFRYLTGVKNPIEAQTAEPDTLHAIVIETLRESLDAAGIDTGEPSPAAEEAA